MEIFLYFCLFLFGTLFGSFSSVIIYRLKSGEKGIMTGRSHCGACNTTLKALDLIPIFSWLIHKGKCAYCKKAVSAVYPFLELSAGTLFALIGYFLIDFSAIFAGDTGEIIKLLFWCIIGILSIIYIFYDILFLEIHEGVMATGVVLMFLALTTQTLFPGFDVFPYLQSGEGISGNLLYGSIILSAGIISGLYFIMLRGLDEKIDAVILTGLILLLVGFKYLFGIELTQIPILNGLIGVLSIFTFFFLQIFVSKGAWLGGGDLRIAIMIGIGLGATLSFPGMMLTYLSGTVISIGYLIYSKYIHKEKSLNTQIPFGPFLAIGFFLALFYQNEILNLMKVYF